MKIIRIFGLLLILMGTTIFLINFNSSTRDYRFSTGQEDDRGGKSNQWL